MSAGKIGMISDVITVSDGVALSHPSESFALYGQSEAENTLLKAFNSGQLAHAWLISGQKGIGKATLAYRFARFLLACGSDKDDRATENIGFSEKKDNLFVHPDHPVFLRVAAGGHADLKTIQRQFDEKKNRYKTEIVIDDVRLIGSFFSLSSAEGGWRIVIIDSVDEMNRNAANAVLKILEEPPSNTVLLLISHNPGRLLPTIRSRCRNLRLSNLDEKFITKILLKHDPKMREEDASLLANLSEGSIGRAINLKAEGGIELYSDLIRLIETLPNLDIQSLHSVASKVSRAGSDTAFNTFSNLFLGWLGRLIIGLAGGKLTVNNQELVIIERFSTSITLASWLELWDKINHLLAKTDSINMDKRQVTISIFLALERTVQVQQSVE